MGFLIFVGVLAMVYFLYTISQTIVEIREELKTTNRTTSMILTQQQSALMAKKEEEATS